MSIWTLWHSWYRVALHLQSNYELLRANIFSIFNLILSTRVSGHSCTGINQRSSGLLVHPSHPPRIHPIRVLKVKKQSFQTFWKVWWSQMFQFLFSLSKHDVLFNPNVLWRQWEFRVCKWLRTKPSWVCWQKQAQRYTAWGMKVIWLPGRSNQV